MTTMKIRSTISSFTICTLLIYSCLLVTLLQAGELKSDSSAMIILDENEMIIESAQQATFKKHCIIQVNSAEGERFGRITLYENKFVEINSIHAFIKDLNGKVLKKLNKKEIKESTLTPGYILYEDTKYTYFELDYSTYPYLLEYDYENRVQQSFFLAQLGPAGGCSCLKIHL